MDQFWTRRASAERLVHMGTALVAVSFVAVAVALFAALWFAGTSIFGVGSSVPVAGTYVAAALLGGMLGWIFVRTLRAWSTRMLLAGVGARVLDDRHPHESSVREIAEQLLKKVGLPRAEVLVSPIPAVNALCVRTFDDRRLLILGEGMISALQFRHIEALIAHGLARLTLPETRATAFNGLLFGLLRQIHVGSKVFDRLPKGTGLVHARWAGGFFDLLGTSLSWLQEPTAVLRADHEAVLLTHDPIGLAEALVLIAHQWRGAGVWSQSFGPMGIQPLRGTGAGKLVARAVAPGHPSVAERVARLNQLTSRIANIEFEAAAVRAHHADSTTPSSPVGTEEAGPRFQVYSDDQVMGDYAPKELEGLPWFHSQSIVRQNDTGATAILALRHRILDRAFARRAQPCPRCGLTLQPMRHGTHDLTRCPRCRGVLVGPHTIAELGIKHDSLLSTVVGSGVSGGIDRMIRAWNAESWPDVGRIYLRSTCPRCRKAMSYQRVDPKVVAVVLGCATCSVLWFDAEVLAQLVSGFPRFFPLRLMTTGAGEMELPSRAYGFRQIPTSAKSYDALSGAPTHRVVARPRASEPVQPQQPSLAVTTPVNGVRMDGPKNSGMSPTPTPLPQTALTPDASNRPDRRAASLHPSPPQPDSPTPRGATSTSAPTPPTPDAKPHGPVPPRRGGLIRHAFVPGDADEIRRKRLLRERRQRMQGRRPPSTATDDKP